MWTQKITGFLRKLFLKFKIWFKSPSVLIAAVSEIISIDTSRLEARAACRPCTGRLQVQLKTWGTVGCFVAANQWRTGSKWWFLCYHFQKSVSAPSATQPCRPMCCIKLCTGLHRAQAHGITMLAKNALKNNLTAMISEIYQYKSKADRCMQQFVRVLPLTWLCLQH